VEFNGRTVIVNDGNVDKALRKFKKKIAVSGILLDVKKREEYTKPTTQRKLKRSAAKNRWRRYVESQTLPAKKY
jgi:small subunit ribosomal protein S21